MPMNTDPTTPAMLGVYPYLIILIPYPITTVRNPMIVTLPDFFVMHTLATYSPEETDISTPTFRNRPSC